MTSIRVGIAGTSWWADAMYLPALKVNVGAEVVAACGSFFFAAAGFFAAAALLFFAGAFFFFCNPSRTTF